jgi:spermidine synthase
MIRYRFIKKADKRTLGQLMELYREQGWWTDGDKPALLGRMLRGSFCFIVAVEEGRVVGAGRAIDAYSNEVYIHDVAVLRARRGRDIGSELMRRLVARLKARGIVWIGLISSSYSSPFYRKLGFVSPPGATAMMLGHTNV